MNVLFPLIMILGALHANLVPPLVHLAQALPFQSVLAATLHISSQVHFVSARELELSIMDFSVIALNS